MPAAEVTRGPSSRALAGVLATALGAHTWIATFALPAAFVAPPSALAQAAAALGLAALGLGLWRRSEALLLFGAPAGVIAAILASPELASLRAYDPPRLAAVAASSAGYLFAAAAFCTRAPPPPRARRALPEVELRAPWPRRIRIYRALALLSGAFPLVLFYAIHVHPPYAAYATVLYGDRAGAYATALTLLALVAWFGIFTYAFAGVLGAHRTGDRDLRASLAALGRRPRPSLRVALAAAAALALAIAYAAVGAGQ